MLFLLLFFFTVDVGEETPRTVCSGLVGSVQLEELQVHTVQPFLYQCATKLSIEGMRKLRLEQGAEDIFNDHRLYSPCVFSLTKSLQLILKISSTYGFVS